MKRTLNVAVGTQNSEKILAVEDSFKEVLNLRVQCLGINVNSGVPDTPIEEETIKGSLTRIRELKQQTKADYYVGIESGLFKLESSVLEHTLCAVSNGKSLHIGMSSALEVPTAVLDKMAELGIEHNQAMPLVRREHQIADEHSDTWGTYTKGIVSREQAFLESLRNALLPFRKDTLY